MLLPLRHVSSGCFQASPLYSPYPVLCLCACSVVVTSLAVSRLQVAFWGNPSHRAGARGAMLVSIRGRLEGQPAGQICRFCQGLTPGLCSGTNGVPSGRVDPTISPTSPSSAGNGVPAISLHQYLCRSKVCMPLPAQHCRKDCRRWLHSAAELARAPAFLPWPWEWRGFCLPPWPSPKAVHGPASAPARLLEASALWQLDSHPAWKPVRRGGRSKAFVALATKGRSASLSFSQSSCCWASHAQPAQGCCS